MFDSEFNPARIRKCELITIDEKPMIQFIATGDRHKMIKQEDGTVEIIKLYEQGKDYKYHDPYPLDDALKILDEGHFETHQEIASQIRKHLDT